MDNFNPPVFYTHLYVLLDCSGSMAGQEEQVVEGINSVLDATFAMRQSQDGSSVGVEIYTFNTTFTQLVPLTRLTRDAPRLKRDDVYMDGATALYDVVGTVLGPDGCRCPEGAVVLIATDGDDTASKEFSPGAIEDLLDHCRKEKHARFVFVAAGSRAYQAAAKMGLCEYECTQVNDNELLGTALSGAEVIGSLTQALMDMGGEEESPSKRKKIKGNTKDDAIEIYSQDYD